MREAQLSRSVMEKPAKIKVGLPAGKGGVLTLEFSVPSTFGSSCSPAVFWGTMYDVAPLAAGCGFGWETAPLVLLNGQLSP